MTKAVGYIRVSTLEQAKDGYSIQAQKEKIKAYAFAKGIDLTQLYVDDGYSGSNLNRPAINEMINNLDKINCVLVYKLDRLSRSQKEVLYLVEDVFLMNGIDFISINETFDTSTSYGRAMIGMLAVFSQLERENIIQRSKFGKEQRAREGYFSGGNPPLGYNYENGYLSIDNVEAEIIKKIYNLYSKGHGYNSICNQLRNSSIVGKKGGSFTPSKINKMLTNPTYKGFISYNDNLYKGKHKPIIEPSTYDKVQSIIEHKKSMAGYSYTKNDSLMYSGLLQCGLCGSKVFIRRLKNSEYYTCYSYHGSPQHMIKTKGCKLGLINKKTVDNYVISGFLSINPNDYVDIKSLCNTENNSYLNSISKDLHHIWKEATFDEKKAMIRGLINKVYLYKDRINVEYS